MKILALETSTDACSAALFIDGDIQEKFALTPKAHTRLILPMVDELLADAQLKPQQLQAIALSRGPGSFTGVRIATGVAQGIALGADLPIVPVSTLAAIAQYFFNQQPKIELAFTAMDARMGEIFWGVFQRNALGLAELTGEEAVTLATDIIFPDRSGFGVGSGWGVYADILQQNIGERLLGIDALVHPHAAAVAQLGAYGFANGQAVDVEQALPVYLRDKVAKTQAERSAI
ncbi:tRNA (adenosine(37)-N6)-threonylcarbamoyltransferase complex dimerization subunit type 1 TsaB [Methylomonas sp. AM2-LC]|uniref:tRNA (adenosine(37)-N6)-threonylcarbamoyltransferase complex dimerization subunit type 1 TsaB n=1 Tax=Methylomonas sp. AM2-LC TaxID=3153301 RepID=UPI003266E695